MSVPPVPAPTTSSYHYSSQTMSTISGKSSRDVRSTFYVSPTTTAHGSSRQSTSSYHTSNVTPAYHSSQTTTSAESPNATYSIESTTTTVSTPQWSSTAMLTPVNTSSQAESPSATPTQSVVVPAEVNTSSVTQAFVISLNGSTVSVSAASSYQSATISPTSVPTEGELVRRVGVGVGWGGVGGGGYSTPLSLGWRCAPECSSNGAVISLSLRPRVINFKFPLQPHQKYYNTQYEELGFS